MSIDFRINDVIHKLTVKFVKALLPDARKPYYLKAMHQPELDIHGIASKAAVYNLKTRPEIIEEGLTAGIQLIYYLAADGFKIKTPLFNLRLKVPGEYDGIETGLVGGIYPVAKLNVNREFRKYLREKVRINIDGIDQRSGFIGEVLDEATGLSGQVMTKGNMLTINGYGLKIDSDNENEHKAGVFFVPQSGEPVKAAIIPVNEPRKIRVIVPDRLETGVKYSLFIGTMSTLRGTGALLKNIREIRSDFLLTA